MFTGIIEKTTRVVSAGSACGMRNATFRMPRLWKLKTGQSISIDGICSTVVVVGENSFTVNYVPETLLKTTAESFTKGRLVNLERPLRYHARIGGNIVQGHVDGRGRVLGVRARGRARELEIALPKSIRRFVAGKGSLTVNGVALTVVAARSARATVALIPYTLSHTTLGMIKRGDSVNVEADPLSRYGALVRSRAHARVPFYAFRQSTKRR